MDPATDTASLFLKMAVSKGMIDDDLAKQVYQEFQRTSRDPSSILLERSILTPYQAENLRREVEKALGPKTIGGFRIIGKLGQGGMGVVYKATQLSMNRVVALKVLAENLASNAEFAERFLREAHAAAKVDHPHVVTVHDVGKDGGLLFLAMQYVAGGDAERLARSCGGRLPPRRAAEIVRDAARGLAAIHRAGLIHRDIKPSNIFITDEGLAKLADLGLSRSDAGDDRMTMTGSIMGTPAFMAPEQARGESDLDIRCDIYSLGATLYTLLAGRPPFTGSSPLAIAAEVIKEPFPDPVLACPGLPAELGAIIGRCTAKPRSERFQTPGELAAALDALLPRLPLETLMAPAPTPAADAGQATKLLPVSEAKGGEITRVTSLAAAPPAPLPTVPLAHAMPAKARRVGLILVLVPLALCGAGAASWWFGFEAPRREALAVEREQAARQEAARAARSEAARHAAPAATAAAKAPGDEPQLLAREEARSQPVLALIAAVDDSAGEADLARVGGTVSDYLNSRPPEGCRTAVEQAWAAKQAHLLAVHKRAKEEQERMALEEAQAKPLLASIAQLDPAASDAELAQAGAQVAAFLGRKPGEPWRTTVEQAWMAHQVRQRAQRAQAGAAQPVLEAIAALPATASAGQVAELQRRVDAYLAAHGQDAQAATVGARLRQALAAVAARRAAAVAAQQEVLRLIAGLGESPAEAAVASVRGQVDGFTTSAAPQDLRAEVTAAWDAQRKRMGQVREFGAPLEAWMTAKGRDAYGWWAEMAVRGATQRLRWIQPGTFLMGSPPGEEGRDSQEAQHGVTLTCGFWLADSPCTQGLWAAVMGANPSHSPAGAGFPVENVSWDEVQGFLAQVNRQVRGVRLPTEAEWEYACRAGTTGPYAASSLDELGWYQGNSGGASHAVKTRTANAWGLYDMQGNVAQWCADWWSPSTGDAATDPTGPASVLFSGTGRVVRGGGWDAAATACRSAARGRMRPGAKSGSLGFRCAASPSSPVGPALPAIRATPPGTASPPLVPEWAASNGSDAGGAWAEATLSGVVQRFRLLRAGTFQMGSPASEEGHENQETQHGVTLTRDFWLADSPCTQGLWAAVMGANPSHFTGGAAFPVETVSWEDVQEFLSRLHRQAPSLRLPTEAEWEYACRAGATGPFAAAGLDALGWYKGNSGRTTHAVKTRMANAWGLYDMQGNVAQWCADWFGQYPTDTATDPAGPESVLTSFTGRIYRGGGWDAEAAQCRAAARARARPGYRSNDLGFRLAAPAPEPR